MDVLMTVFPWGLAAAALNLTLAAAGGAFVLFFLSRRRSAAAVSAGRATRRLEMNHGE